MFSFTPALFQLKDYSKERFLRDLNAGLVVGIIVLPLALAFAIASGVTPDKGLIAAILGGFIALWTDHSSLIDV